MDFLVFSPEINSALMYAGAGAGPLFLAAAAWDGLAADLGASASSFDAVIANLAGGPWTGPAAAAMTAAAAPYVAWLSAAAARAQGASAQARVAATTFEAAQTATVHPAAVTANRVSLTALVATNFLGQNTPAIAATESDYVEMWAQDVGAMLGYHAGALGVAASLAPLELPPVNLAGLASQLGAQVTGAVSAAGAALAPAVESVVSDLPVSELSSFAQIALTPVSILISPLMSLAQTANAGTAGLAGAAASVGADIPKLVGDTAPAMKGLGGAAGLGGAGSAGLGQARLVGKLSVPPAWAGSMPKGMASSAISGLGGMTSQAAAPAAQAGTGGMPMMPMPMGAGGAGAGMPPGMMGRGGANPQVVQARPSVIPRSGVG
jgi:PPE-repeat protein